jgi:hypothetical protein
MKLVRHRKSSSVSRRKLRNRRNKSGSRKKYAHTHTHTIKGGCWGKKGGARSRRYGHKRTHKRGKRFHRGGEETPMNTILEKIQNMKLNHDRLYTLGDNDFLTDLPIISLRYKKQGELFPETKEFYLNVIYDKNNPERTFKITLRRLPGKQDDPPYFEYDGDSLSTGALIVSDTLKEENSVNIKKRLYNFNYPENRDKLDNILRSVTSFIGNITRVPSSTNSVDVRTIDIN